MSVRRLGALVRALPASARLWRALDDAKPKGVSPKELFRKVMGR